MDKSSTADDINQDWGGKPFDDLMAVTDYVEKLPPVGARGPDGTPHAADRTGGLHDRLDARPYLPLQVLRIRCREAIYDLREEAQSTEELWFPMWEFGGMPWDNPEVYNKWSPSLFAKEFQTPTLVVHGELDFRIPYSQGLELFTALQVHKVPSRNS